MVTKVKGVSTELMGLAPVVADGSNTSRTLGERFADVVNVIDFGATGDGVTDDSDAIQAAFNSVELAFGQDYYFSDRTDGPATVYFPRGLYRTTREITVPRGLKVIGDNARNHGGTTIWNSATDGSYCFNLYHRFDSLSGPQYIADQQISGFMFRNADGGAIRATQPNPVPPSEFYSSGSLSISDCFFLGMSASDNTNPPCAIWSDGIERVENCTFDAGSFCGIRTSFLGSCTGNIFFSLTFGGIVMDNVVGNNTAITTIAGNNFYDCGDTALAVGPFGAAIGVISTPSKIVQGVNISGNTIWGGGGGSFGIRCDTGVADLNVTGNTFKTLAGNAINIEGGIRVLIDSNLITGCGNTGSGSYIVDITGSDRVTIKDNQWNDNGGLQNIVVDSTSSRVIMEGNFQDVERSLLQSTRMRRTNAYSGTFTSLVNALLPASEWVNATYVNGWDDYINNPVRFRRNELGEVTFEGAMQGGGNQGLCMNIPSQFRPALNKFHTFIVSAQSSPIDLPLTFAQITINHVGEVYVTSSGGTDYISFDNIRYTAWL